MDNRTLRLVKGAPVTDDLLCKSGATMPIGGAILSLGGMYVLNNTWSGSLLLLSTVLTSLDGGSEEAASLEGDPSQMKKKTERNQPGD